VYAGRQPLFASDRTATQVARIRFNPRAVPPVLNSSVSIRMYYTDFTFHIVAMLVRLFGLD
jgi:hypothetical protein